MGMNGLPISLTQRSMVPFDGNPTSLDGLTVRASWLVLKRTALPTLPAKRAAPRGPISATSLSRPAESLKLFGAGSLGVAPTDPVKRAVWEKLRDKHGRVG